VTIKHTTIPAQGGKHVVGYTQWAEGHTITDSITMPKASGVGIKIDTASPDFGWRDIIGTPQEPLIAAGRPAWAQIATSGVYTWSFGTGEYQSYSYHIPHDYVPGSAIHFHVHWFSAQTAGAYTKWQFDWIYAKGHGQAPFPTTASQATVEQQQETIAYTHMIAETTGQTIDGCEPDGLIICKVTRIAPAGTDVTGDVFVPVVDLHYQSTNMATKQKSPDFYT